MEQKAKFREQLKCEHITRNLTQIGGLWLSVDPSNASASLLPAVHLAPASDSGMTFGLFITGKENESQNEMYQQRGRLAFRTIMTGGVFPSDCRERALTSETRNGCVGC